MINFNYNNLIISNDINLEKIKFSHVMSHYIVLTVPFISFFNILSLSLSGKTKMSLCWRYFISLKTIHYFLLYVFQFYNRKYIFFLGIITNFKRFLCQENYFFLLIKHRRLFSKLFFFIYFFFIFKS